MQVKAEQRRFCHRTPDGLSLSFRMYGGPDPPQVLLLHGFGDNALVWHHFASTLEDACCVLAMDLRGHGHSAWDPEGTYALADLAADAVNVLDELCPAPVVLVGHSLGGRIAIRAAAARRERIQAIVLADVALKPNQLSANSVRGKLRERQRVYESVADYAALVRQQLPLAQAHLLDVLAQGALRMNEDGRYEQRWDPMLVSRDDSIDTEAVLASLKQIARPILLVRGAASAVLSQAAAQEAMAGLPQSRLRVVAAAGHAVMLENPEGFSASVTPYVLRFVSAPRRKAADELPA
jgi:pimeloyl-ACP methyl ester carboxylesterase